MPSNTSLFQPNIYLKLKYEFWLGKGMNHLYHNKKCHAKEKQIAISGFKLVLNFYVRVHELQIMAKIDIHMTNK